MLQSRMSPSVIVLGGINCDISAAVDGPLQRETSNPGRVSLSPGGVGRNIAHLLGQLAVPVSLVGVVGQDSLSDWVLQRTAAAGVRVDSVIRSPGYGVGVYVSLLAAGELDTAVSDMAAGESLDPEQAVAALERCADGGAADRGFRSGAEASRGLPRRILVIDLNVSPPVAQAALDWAELRGYAVVVEPVSTAKARRLAGLRGRVAVLTPNLAEARVVSELAKTADLPEIDTWIVTRGDQGVGLWRKGDPATRLIHGRRVRTVNANGAGDALVAGLVAGLHGGESVEWSVMQGIAAGAIVAGSAASVAAAISREDLINWLHEGVNDNG